MKNYEWRYDTQTKAGYLKLKDGEVTNTLELVEGSVMLDRDAQGNLLGIEILL